ncbi:MAG: hypothetical protein FRX49_10000 [Trebouxia sp. A1-2]|nr:MAG: hypothetical protein FRX49_10000 [Trebouxia sp. A1-2]
MAASGDPRRPPTNQSQCKTCKTDKAEARRPSSAPPSAEAPSYAAGCHLPPCGGSVANVALKSAAKTRQRDSKYVSEAVLQASGSLSSIGKIATQLGHLLSLVRASTTQQKQQ